MREISCAYGKCTLDKDGVFCVDGKEKYQSVESISPAQYKRDTYIYICMKKGTYKIYSMRERKTLLSNISRVVYKSKTITVVTFGEKNKEKYYLYDFLDQSNNRYIKKIVDYFILEEDGVTLTSTHPSKEAITLPKKCKFLCPAKNIISFYAVSEDNEIFVLPPYPYYDTSVNAKNDTTPQFWKLKEYIKCQEFKNIRFIDLADLVEFENEEDKKLLAMVNILYRYKLHQENIYIDNIDNVLTEKQIKFKQDKYTITLTLDTIIIESKLNKTEYSYDIFKYDDLYLQLLLLYNTTKPMERNIALLTAKKTPVDEAIHSNYFTGDKELLKKFLYHLNCNPNSKIFFIINNKNILAAVNRESFAENIKKALLQGKSYAKIMQRYDLHPELTKRLIKEHFSKDYTKLKKVYAFKH